MGGKGGGGGNYYQQPADTSGYGTPEEAKVTLAKTKPVDLSEYQQAINVKKAAADATAKERIATSTAPPTNIETDLGGAVANAILKPPVFWKEQDEEAAARPKIIANSSGTTTQI
jgi:hypothetical protein